MEKKAVKLKSPKINVLTLILIMVLATVVINTTLAWFSFSGRGEAELELGYVKLDTNVVLTEDLDEVMPNMPVVTSASFTKSEGATDCLVRAKLEYYSNATNLTRAQKNYIVLLNDYEYASKISTNVDTCEWVLMDDGYFYLLDNDGEFVKVVDGESYSLLKTGEHIEFPIVIDDGINPVFDSEVTQLHINVEFQAIQSSYLPSENFEDVVEIFKLCFPDENQDGSIKYKEVLVKFNVSGGSSVVSEVASVGSTISAPPKPTKEGYQFEGWYSQDGSESGDWGEEIKFPLTITNETTIHAKWKEGGSITPGLILLDNKVIGYVGEDRDVVVPETYSKTGNKLSYTHTCNNVFDFYVWSYDLMGVMELGYDISPITITDTVSSVTFNSMQELENNFNLNAVTYPATITYHVDEYEDGDDYTITEIGPCGLGNYGFIIAMSYGNEDNTYISSVTLPSTLRVIDELAFIYQVGLKTLNIPEGVTTLNDGSLAGCMGLISVVLPSSLTTISGDVGLVDNMLIEVVNHSNLTATDLGIEDVANVITSESDSILYTYTDSGVTHYFTVQGTTMKLQSIVGTGVVTTPNTGVTLTGYYDESKTVTLGNYSLAMIKNMFPEFNELILGGGLKSLEDTSIAYFFNCSTVVIENALTSIGEMAFVYNPALEVLVVKKPVQSMPEVLFEECPNLNYILCETSEIAQSFSGKGKASNCIYIKQTSGYESLIFTETETVGISSVTTNGDVWVRTGDEGNYSYYKQFKVENSFTDGLLFHEGAVVGYIGDSQKVIVPTSYDLTGSRKTIVKTANSYLDLMLYVNEIMTAMEIGYDAYPIVMTDSQSNTTTITSFDELNTLDPTGFAYPVTLSYNIDEYVDGETYSVTSIAEGGLANIYNYIREDMGSKAKKTISELVLPEGLTSIGANALAYNYFAQVTIPSTLTTIGANAFADCNIGTLVIPSTVTSIDATAFTGAMVYDLINLSNATFTAGSYVSEVSDINNSIAYKYETDDYTLFYINMLGTTALVNSTTYGGKIELPSSGTTLTHVYNSSATLTLGEYGIVESVFMGDCNIEELVIGENCTLAISEYSFAYCENLEIVTVEADNIGYIGNHAFDYNNSLEYLLADNSKLAGLVISDGVVAVNVDTGYEGLIFSEVQVASTTIAKATDVDITWVRTGSSTSDYKYYKELEVERSFTAGLMMDTEGVVTDYFGDAEDVVIPQTYSLMVDTVEVTLMDVYNNAYFPCTVTTPDGEVHLNDIMDLQMALMKYESYGIEMYSWKCICKVVTAVDGNDYTVTSIGDNAFQNALITSVDIPDTVTDIGDNAFYGCDYLVEIVIPDNVITIGSSAFSNCDGLIRVTLPARLQSVGSWGFSYCYKIIEVINRTTTEITAGNSSTFGGVADNAKDVITDVSDSKLVTVGDFIFYDGDTKYLVAYTGKSTSITLPTSFNGGNYEIYNYFMQDNDKILSVTMTGGVTKINTRAFNRCYNLASLTLCEGLVTIGEGAFMSTPITSITIPTTVTNLGDNCFYSCTMLTEINYNATTVANVTDQVFFEAGIDASGITLTIGANVTVLPDNLFYAMMSNTKYSPNIKSIIFEEGSVCTTIGESAFRMCVAFASITLPDSVATIKGNAFYACGASSIKLGSNVTTIGSGAFTSCTAYVLCANATIAAAATTAGATNVYVIDTTTNFSSITFTSVSSGEVNGTSGTYLRTGASGSYVYYAKYTA